MTLFSYTSVKSALSTFVREGDDSRASQSDFLIATGVSTIVWDEILGGFINDPAIFAAAVSHIACASMAPAKLEELAGVKSIKSLRRFAREVDASIVTTRDESLRTFLTEIAKLGRDGRVWILLVAANLASLRTDQDLQLLIYPNLKETK